jgi:hypothetical protein
MLSARRNSSLVIFMMAGLFAAAVALIGCATIMHGSSQEIGIQSQPTGASVVIDNEDFGVTPVIAKLSRKDNHTIRVSMAGYQPYDATITKSVSGWVWGNIVFGGLIGLAIDAISGGLYKLNPEQVEAELAKQGMGDKLQNGDIIVTFVLEPDPDWEQVGSLTPSSR